MTKEEINKQIKTKKIRFCKKCGKYLTVDNFFIKSDKNKEKFRFNSPCKKCSNIGRNINFQKEYHIIKKYNITLNEYNEKLKEQNFCCAICGKTIKDNIRNLAVDHCHTTNKLRGLLCINCNLGIGNLKDNISILEKAILYLKKYND